MVVYAPHGPVVLNVQITVKSCSENGALRVSDVTVLTVDGEPDARYYGFASQWGEVVLNYKKDGRPAKPEPKATAAPAKAAPAKAAPAAPAAPAKAKAAPAAPAKAAPAEIDAEMQEYLAFQAFQAMKRKAGK
jgi:hypothetical protein